jgi:hypothetical protein
VHTTRFWNNLHQVRNNLHQVRNNLHQIVNSQVVISLKFWTHNWKKYILFSFNFAWKGKLLFVLKGSNSCKMYIFRIDVGDRRYISFYICCSTLDTLILTCLNYWLVDFFIICYVFYVMFMNITIIYINLSMEIW